METARPQAGQPRLRVSNDRVGAADLRPAASVDVQRQEPAHLSGGRLEITISGQHHAGGIPGLGHLCFGAAPVTLGTEHRAQPRPGRLSRQRRRGEALPEPPAGLQRPRARDLELGHTSCHPLLRSIDDTRTVADGTDTKIDPPGHPRTSAPITQSGLSMSRSA
jgi:hypothetical protein